MKHSPTTTAVRLMLAVLALTAGVASAQPPAGPRAPLVPCAAAAADAPCIDIATSAADIAGIWRHPVANPAFQAPDGLGYIAYFPDGRLRLAGSIEDLASDETSYMFGVIEFDGNFSRVTLGREAPLPVCSGPFVHQHQVIRLGGQPVALFVQPVEDECPPRLSDLGVPLIWVAPAP